MADRVQFFFDPSCPWTWMTSRWLVEVAGRLEFGVEWRSLSLAVLNAGREIPERYRASSEAARSALRVVEAAREAGRHEEVGAFYTHLGTRLHHDQAEPGVALVTEVADATGLGDLAGAATDPAWDEPLARSLDAAIAAAGPGVGSPVVVPPGATTGFFGPIVSPPPTGEAALTLWELVRAAATLPGFWELKRGRTEGPRPGPRPAV